MFDTTDMTRRDRAPEDNLIAHLPQDLQDRFYDARDDYYAECAKTERTKKIVIASMWTAMTAPILGVLVTTWLVMHDHVVLSGLGNVIFGVFLVGALAALLVPAFMDADTKVERMLYIWSSEVNDYVQKRYQRVADEVESAIFQHDLINADFWS